MTDRDAGHGMQPRRRVQRAGVFAQLPALLAELGVAAGPVFEAAGIERETLTAATEVPLDSMLDALARAVHATGREDLGLLLGGRFTLEVHGVVGRIMRCAPTLRHALLDFVRWQQGYSTAAVVYFVPMGEDVAWGFACDAGGHPGARPLQDAVMAVALRMLHLLTGVRLVPREVLLSHRRPADVSPYAAVVRGPVRFDQHLTCVILDQRSLEMRLPGEDAALHARLEVEAEAMAPAPGVAAQVRREMRPALYRGEPGMAPLAQRLGLTPRTLRRRLDAEGQSFAALRDEVRLTMARELLRLTALPGSDIALALCFASHGAFIAAFRRWMGMTPSAWRAGREDVLF
jgi:AraC-like DNA-binding protein